MRQALRARPSAGAHVPAAASPPKGGHVEAVDRATPDAPAIPIEAVSYSRAPREAHVTAIGPDPTGSPPRWPRCWSTWRRAACAQRTASRPSTSTSSRRRACGPARAACRLDRTTRSPPRHSRPRRRACPTRTGAEPSSWEWTTTTIPSVPHWTPNGCDDGSIYDLSQRHLTVEATEHDLDGNRLLVLRCPEAVEPVRMDGRIRWRVGDACVEVDAATWHEHRLRRIGYDWSAQPSAVPVGSARAGALETARGFLRASREEHSLDLADAPNLDLLTRLDVVTADGMLTNAGVVAFVGREAPGLDYVRREAAGGDSLNRVRRGGRGLVEELSEVEQAIRLANPVRHVPDGLVAGPGPGAARRCRPRDDRQRLRPSGLAHRRTDSHRARGRHPGGDLPGGFIGGVTAQNIMTHPSQPRNRSLAELFAALRVAEREGVGVDRMVREMVRSGTVSPTSKRLQGPTCGLPSSARSSTKGRWPSSPR